MTGPHMNTRDPTFRVRTCRPKVVVLIQVSAVAKLISSTLLLGKEVALGEDPDAQS